MVRAAPAPGCTAQGLWCCDPGFCGALPTVNLRQTVPVFEFISMASICFSNILPKRTWLVREDGSRSSVHGSHSSAPCALWLVKEGSAVTFTSEPLNHTSRCPEPAACSHSRSHVYGNPGRLLTEGLAAFIPWGFWNVLGRRALLLVLAVAAAVFGDSVDGNTAHCFHVLSAERQLAAAGNAVSYGCEAVPCSWLLSSHRITGLGFCKVPFTALWSTEGTRRYC